MDTRNLVARIATLLLLSACSKPKLTGVADGVVNTLNNFSSQINASLKGGFTVAEAQKCQQEKLKFEGLELPTKAKVNIYVSPSVFSLYTEEHAYTDTDPSTWYEVDVNKRLLKTYTHSWGSWSKPVVTKLPDLTNERYILAPDYSKVKVKLPFENPFRIPRSRLGVRLGIVNAFSEADTSISLGEGEMHGVLCAGALNSYFEALLKTEYDFK